MRVISGSARGLKLTSPQNTKIRPTTDRIKEDIFNIISFDLIDIKFLDIFSGSGAIGLEALSRGANHAFFIDNDKSSINIIKANLQKASLLQKSTIINLDVDLAIDYLKNSNFQFDIIFMDPPYEKGLIYTTLQKIYTSNILKKYGFIICEQSIKENLPSIKEFYIFKIKKYKTTKILFLKLENSK